MKKSEIVLLWVSGMWAVVCLIGIAASGGRWDVGVALIFAGWLVCGLLWFTISNWPKRGSAGASNGTADGTAKKAHFRRAAVAGFGYLLSLVFLFSWITALAQIGKERNQMAEILSHLKTGQLDAFDCVSLPAALVDSCMAHVKEGRRVPKHDLPDHLQTSPDTSQDKGAASEHSNP